MGKKSKKRSSIREKDNAGCLWRFIGIFESSQSYNLQKLPSERKRGSARYLGSGNLGNNLFEETWERKYEHDANDADGHEATIVLSRLPSVKALIEEEMSKERTSKTFGCVLEKFKCREPVVGSSLIFDLTALMIEFYSASHYCPDMREEIEVDLFEAEAFLSQKIDNAKRLVGNGVMQSQEFMDALEILNSNKELFLQMIQNPNELVFRHIQELLKPQVADLSKLESHLCLEETNHLEENLGNSGQYGKSFSNQTFLKQKQQFLPKKEDKCRGEIASKIRNTSEEMSSIVVLKSIQSRNLDDSTQNSPCLSPQPSYTKKHEKDRERALSHFSFGEIKRKLRNLIGESRKGKHLISMGGLLNENLCDYKSSDDTIKMISTENCRTNVPSQTDCSTENSTSFLAVSKSDKKAKLKQCQQNLEAKLKGLSPVSLFHGESFNVEADKHFSEIHNTEYRTASWTNNQISTSLEEMHSPSDCNPLSPRFSPHRVKELKSSPHEMMFSTKQQLIDDTSTKLSPKNALKETPRIGDIEVEMLVINIEAANDEVGLQEESFYGEQLNTEGREEIVEIEKIKSVLHINPAEECNTSNIPAASVGSEHGSSCERCKEGCSTPPEHEPRILIPESLSPSCLIVNHFESSEFITEKPDRPSPVSVLEPLFLEDDASPDRENNTFDFSMARDGICSYDMEVMTKYVRTVTETYSLCSETSAERRLFPQPSLLDDEIIALQRSYPEDPKLLLDCVNELYLEMKDRRFQISPWVSFLQPAVRPIPVGDVVIQEVCKAIESCLSSHFESTLNEMMKKDMSNAMWQDHRLEMECVIADICCIILEETIFELFLLTCN